MRCPLASRCQNTMAERLEVAETERAIAELRISDLERRIEIMAHNHAALEKFALENTTEAARKTASGYAANCTDRKKSCSNCVKSMRIHNSNGFDRHALQKMVYRCERFNHRVDGRMGTCPCQQPKKR